MFLVNYDLLLCRKKTQVYTSEHSNASNTIYILACLYISNRYPLYVRASLFPMETQILLMCSFLLFKTN